jgi:MoaA/NifB/PqqE/SkfB family radical SAM enzyme
MRPRYPIEGVVSWNMNTTCNYRCSYCTQRFVDDRAQWARDLPRFVEAFTGLPGDWEVKLSGGEPFRHPGFLDAVRALADGGIRVSVVTNFSASRTDLEHFAAATEAKPGLLSASLHREYVDDQTFLDKLIWFRGVHNGTLCATVVATRAWLSQLPAIRARYAQAGITLKVQPRKEDREVIDYTEAERAALLALGGHNNTGAIAPSFQGAPCWAGSRYLIVDHRGEAYRCYPARRFRKERLGNLLEGTLELRTEPRPCPYSYCNCTVPQHRGMMALPSQSGV